MAIGKNINPRKSLGQHWLKDLEVLESICDLAELDSNDVVLEIGPGTGNLTKLLAQEASKVLAVELDPHLVEYLNKINIQDVEVIHQDILSFNFNDLPIGYKIVANIPYYLTSKIIRAISDTDNKAKIVILLVQKEIAERLSAKPGNMSILGATCQYYWDPYLGPIVGPEKFIPPPKVDSQLIILKPKTDLKIDKKYESELFRIIKIGFAAKRKTLVNNLSSALDINKQIISELITRIGLNPNTRPQELSLEDWKKIEVELKKIC